MMRSLYSAVTGLKTHQYKMDVIANNLSNINTIGFKRSSVTFANSLSQSLGSASAADESTGRGGQNGSAIGLGVGVGSISNIMTQGSAQTTSNANDLMINGDGFFVVKDSSGYYFTRSGAFEVDAAGNIVDGSGYTLCGWQAKEDAANPGTQKIVKDVVSPLNIYDGNKTYSPAAATTSIKASGNLNVSTNPTQTMTFSFYDSVGNSYMATGTLTYNPKTAANGGTNGNNKWTLTIDTKVVVNGTETVEMNADNLNNPILELEFENGVLKTPQNATLKITPKFKNETDNKYNSTFKEITVDFSGLTQFNSTVTASTTTVDGNTAGSMTGYGIDSNGIITATYSNGKTRTLGQVALANFSNPAGLESVGGSLYKASNNSGDFDFVGVEANSISSSILSGSLEMSNVDISYEFTEMITTQRGFQASSRLITTGNEMIQTLVNM